MIRGTIFMAAMFLCASAIAIDDTELGRLVKDDLATEHAECGAYFVFSAEGFRRSMPEGPERDKEFTDWMALSSEAMQRSITLGSKEKSVAVTRLALEKIKRMTKSSYDNWSIAAAEYAYICKDLMDEPRKRVEYWLDKERRNAPP